MGAAKLGAHAPELARNPQWTRSITKVTADLALNRRRRERTECHTAGRIEAFARFNQPNRSELNEIIEFFAAAGVAARHRPDQREVSLDQLLSRGVFE
jgi:hypothetical protein